MNEIRKFTTNLPGFWLWLVLALIIGTVGLPFWWSFVWPAEAVISDGANAVNVAGQLDGSVTYTEGRPNDGLTAIGLDFPGDVVVDTTDKRLFVADCNNNRVVVYNLNTSNDLIDYTADNVLGQSSLTTYTEAPTSGPSSFNCPNGLAFDDAGDRLFVSDSVYNRVMVFDVSTIIDGENAVSVLGQTDFLENASGTSSRTFDSPQGLAFEEAVGRDELYVVDQNNNRVMVFDVDSIADGEAAVNVLGQVNFVTGDSATSQRAFNTPEDVILDASSQLYVTDQNNNRVMVFDVSAITDGENATKVLGQDDFDTSTAGTPPTIANLETPTGLAYHNSNSWLFVGDQDNSRVMVFDVGDITDGEDAVKVLGESDFTTNSGGQISQGDFYGVGGMFVEDTTNLLWVTDLYNNRVLNFDVADITNGENANNVAGQYKSSSAIYTSGASNNGPIATGLADPSDIVVDTTNNRLFVVDNTNSRILVYNLDASNQLVDYTADAVLGQPDFMSGSVLGGTTRNTLNDPRGIDYDAVKNLLFVADASNSRIMVFDVASITDGEDALYVLGQPDFTSTNGVVDDSTLAGNFDVAYDSVNDYLYAADSNNNRVMVFDVASISNGEPAIKVLGQLNFSTSSTGLTSSTFNTPQGVSIDTGNNRLFVSDVSNNRVMVFDVSTITNGEAADNVLGQTDFAGNVPACTQAGLISVHGVEYDSINDRLYVSDEDGYRVMVYDVSTISDGDSAVNVLGQSSFTSCDSATVSQSVLSVPTGLDYNASSNRLFVADTGNNRIMMFDAEPNSAPTATVPASITQATDGTGYMSFVTTVDDGNDNDSKLKVEYSDDGGSTWYAPYLTSVLATTGSPDLALSNLYTVTQHPFNYGGSDYEDVTGAGAGIVFVYNDTVDAAEDFLDITTNDQDISAIISDTPQTWNLALVSPTGPSPKYSFYVDDAKFPDAITTKAYLDALGGGPYTVDLWADDVFVSSGGTYSYTAPSGLTVMTDYQPGTPTLTTTLSTSYQIGSFTAISTVSGANTLTITWDSKSTANTSTAMDDTEQSDIQVRVTPNDSADDGSVQTSASFTVDNLDPSGLTVLTSSAQSLTSVTLDWTAVIETNFDHYELWYGTNQSDVETRAGSALEWDNVSDATLATISTTDTTITGLSVNTLYYFDILAVDDYGNEHSVSLISKYTLANTPTSVSENSVSFTEITVDADGAFPNLTLGGSGLYFENVTAGTNSGWVQSTSWASTGLSPNTPYEFRVKARNGDSVETSFTSATSINTAVPPSGGGPGGYDDGGDDPDPEPSKQCADGIDNDSDGDIDLDDDGCADGLDNDESDELTEPPVLNKPADGILTNNNQPYIIGTTPEGVISLDIYIDDVKIYTVVSQGDKSFVWKTIPALLDGLHEIYVKVQNLESSVHTILVDTAPPNSPLIDLITVESQAPIGDDINASLKIQGQVYSDTKYVLLYLDDNILIDTIEVTNSDWSYDYNEVLSPGKHKISAKAIDEADNVSVVPTEENFDLFISGDNTDDPIVDDPIVDDPVVDGPIYDVVDGKVDWKKIENEEPVPIGIKDIIQDVVEITKLVQSATIDNPVVEKVNDVAKQEVIGVVTATSIASLATVGVTGTAGASALTYLQFLFTQPLMLLTRRKKRGWGVIYNSITKQPVDLAVVRVYNSETEKLVTTRVTDKQGRYQFILKPGKYKIVADKKEFKFPSTLLNKATLDDQFNDVYYGDEIAVTEKDAVAMPIPMDPNKMMKKGKSEIKMYMIRKGQLALTFAGPTLAIISFIVNPELWVGGVVIGQIAMYGVFKKLAIGDKPKNWGVVKNVDNKKKLARSIVRVFDTKFNKLLETQVTDGKGRYAFLVGNQEYFITAEKPGFHKKQSERFNLSGEESGYLAEDFKLRPHHLGKEVKKAQEAGAPVTIRTGLGGQKEKEVNGQKKVVRRDEEKFKGELKEVDLENVHEDYYNLDVLKREQDLD